jgi:hypothetical protein
MGYRQQRNFTTAARSCENPKIKNSSLDSKM